MNLYVDEDGNLLTPLTKLEHLRELKLLGGYNPHTSVADSRILASES